MFRESDTIEDMKKGIVKFCTIVGAVVVALAVFGLAMAVLSRFNKPNIPDHAVLELELDGRGLPEEDPSDPLALLTGGGNVTTLKDVLDALRTAGKDDKVKGLIVRLGASPIAMANLQELRDAFARFRAQKKFIYAYSESFGGLGNYYLASAGDRVFLLPGGDAAVMGMNAQSPFIRGALDKIGVVPHFEGRYEYKNAVNMYMERKFTDAHREATTKLVGGLFDQLVRGIAASRKLTPEHVKAAIDKAPHHGKEAVEAKLVDELAYRDEVNEKAKAKAGEGAKLLYLETYLERAGRPNTSGDTVALVYGVGAINQGRSGYDPLGGEHSMGSDTVSAALRQAINDKKVKAIVFRVDSPGGSAVASDAIAREVVRARKAGKPVVISMGGVAASGGYWVSMDADRIVAQPATITGSIGVLSGKPVTAGMWEKLGITWDGVKYGQNAAMYDGGTDFSPSELERFRAGLDFIYDNFTKRVAAGRKMKQEEVHKVAKGRVWTGEDAKPLGLVDELGGLETALAAAKKLAKIPEKDDVDFRQYPRPKSPWEALQERLLGRNQGDNSERNARVGDEGSAGMSGALRELQPFFRRLRASGLLPERRGELTMLPLEIRF